MTIVSVFGWFIFIVFVHFSNTRQFTNKKHNVAWWEEYNSAVHLTAHERQILSMFDSYESFSCTLHDMWRYNIKKLTIKQSIQLLLQQPKDNMELWG